MELQYGDLVCLRTVLHSVSAFYLFIFFIIQKLYAEKHTHKKKTEAE